MRTEYLTPAQVAAELHLKHAGTLANWRAEKPPRGPRWVKHGRRVLYPIAEVEAYKEREFKSETPPRQT